MPFSPAGENGISFAHGENGISFAHGIIFFQPMGGCKKVGGN